MAFLASIGTFIGHTTVWSFLHPRENSISKFHPTIMMQLSWPLGITCMCHNPRIEDSKEKCYPLSLLFDGLSGRKILSALGPVFLKDCWTLKRLSSLLFNLWVENWKKIKRKFNRRISETQVKERRRHQLAFYKTLQSIACFDSK